VYLDREADIVGQLLSGAAGVLEALDVQQQHLWQAVDAQPLCGLCLLTTLLALEALITLSSNLHSLCTVCLHVLYVQNNLYVLRAWYVLKVLHGLCVFCISSCKFLVCSQMSRQTVEVVRLVWRTCSLSSEQQGCRKHLSQGYQPHIETYCARRNPYHQYRVVCAARVMMIQQHLPRGLQTRLAYLLTPLCWAKLKVDTVPFWEGGPTMTAKASACI